MTYYTHVLGGAVAAAALLQPMSIDGADIALFIGGSVVGALLPDIDHSRSKISKSSAAASATSWLITAFTKHRGVLHTPIFILGTAVLLLIGIPLLPGEAQTAGMIITLGLLIGMLSHLVLDTLNPGGIMWAYPLSKSHYHILTIKTGSIGEAGVTAILLFVLAIIFENVSN